MPTCTLIQQFNNCLLCDDTFRAIFFNWVLSPRPNVSWPKCCNIMMLVLRSVCNVLISTSACRGSTSVKSKVVPKLNVYVTYSYVNWIFLQQYKSHEKFSPLNLPLDHGFGNGFVSARNQILFLHRFHQMYCQTWWQAIASIQIKDPRTVTLSEIEEYRWKYKCISTPHSCNLFCHIIILNSTVSFPDFHDYSKLFILQNYTFQGLYLIYVPLYFLHKYCSNSRFWH